MAFIDIDVLFETIKMSYYPAHSFKKAGIWIQSFEMYLNNSEYLQHLHHENTRKLSNKREKWDTEQWMIKNKSNWDADIY